MGPDQETPATADPGQPPSETAHARRRQTEAEAVELVAAPDMSVADVPPELLAQSLGQYLRASWLRVRGGDSGVLPVLLAMVVVAVVFQIITPEHSFLRPSNLVYIFGLSTVYMVLAIAETIVLLIAEIDLSVGAVALIGGVIAFKLVQQPGAGWPWWAAIIAAFVSCGVFGALQGTLTARLKIPSFVVTLAGFLLFSGILIVALGGADGSVNLNTSDSNQAVIYNLVQGTITPVASWILLVVAVGIFGTSLWLRAASRRRQGLVAPPKSVTAVRIVLVASSGQLWWWSAMSTAAPPSRPCRDSVGDPDRSRRGWRLDARAPADPLRPLHLCDRRQPGGRPPGGVSLARIRTWGFALCSATADSAASCSVPFSTVSTAPIRRPRSARPLHRSRRGDRRGQPLRRPG